MRRERPRSTQRIDDVGTPTLLLVAAVGVVAAVVGIVLASSTGTALGAVLALVIAVAGLVAVTAVITRQMDDADGEGAPPRR